MLSSVHHSDQVNRCLCPIAGFIDFIVQPTMTVLGDMLERIVRSMEQESRCKGTKAEGTGRGTGKQEKKTLNTLTTFHKSSQWSEQCITAIPQYGLMYYDTLYSR